MIVLPVSIGTMNEEIGTPVNVVAHRTDVQPLSDWHVSPGGRLGFTANWTGTLVNGSFGRWDSRIRFTPDALEKTKIRVSVDLGSAKTGDSQRDESLAGADFFETATYPNAVFSADGVRALGNDRYEARGSLDLHGKKLPITVVFKLKIENDKASVNGSTRIDRTSFGVGSGEWASTDQIEANVAVSFDFTATRMSVN